VSGSPIRISVSRARKLAIWCQGLDDRRQLPPGKEGAAQIIERLGHVQIDTIAVVERAHHHQLWSRCPDYSPAMLHELQATDRRVFEGWTHAASYIPMCDYRFYLPGMRAAADAPRTREWLGSNAGVAEQVMERVREEGPLGSADFNPPPDFKRGTWWHWKPAKVALEILFATGRLMVSERHNFQRLYDLTERVLPSGVDTGEPEADEMARFVARRQLAALSPAPVGLYRGRGFGSPDTAAGIAELIDEGVVTPLRIEGLTGSAYLALTEALEQTPRRGHAKRRVHILSPFDQLLARHDRLRELFGFEHKLEAYFPAAKRKWGYFCLPILWGERFVGRLDAKAERKQRVLCLRRLLFEDGFRDYDALLPSFAEKLREFAAFNNCDEVVVEQCAPRKMRAAVRRALAEAETR